MIYSEKIRRAIKFAIKTHDVYQKQTRKGKPIAYITHPLTVGIILAIAGASEDVIAAGILHDTIEDSVPEKKVTFEMLEERFEENVAKLVLSVTEMEKSHSWEARKKQALEHIKHFSHDSLLVKSADIVANMSELLDDHARYGDQIFERFSAPKDKVIAHQMLSIATIVECWPENPLHQDLQNIAVKIDQL